MRVLEPGADPVRRSLLKHAGLALLTTGLPGSGLALEGLADLHERVASYARNRRGQRETFLRVLLPDGCQENVTPIAQLFEEKTGIRMQLVWVDVDRINERLMLDHMTREEEFDLALPASFGIPDLVEAGILLNLEPFAERYEPENLQEGHLYTVADFYSGHPYGFQADGDVYVMFYNKPWLEDPANQERFADRHGFALKTAETWEELDTQLAFFHDPANGRFGGALFRNPDYLVWEWWLRFHAKGGQPMTDAAFPAINSDLGVDALIEMISATRFLHPECKTAGLFRNWEIFSEGHCFANIGWGGTQKFVGAEGSPMRGKLAYGPTPGERVNGKLNRASYFNWGWEYTVMRSAHEPELAYLFALFASTPAMSLKSVQGRGGFFDPYRIEHYQDPIIREIYSDEFLGVHKQSLMDAIPDFYMPGQADYRAALQNNILLAFDAVVTPEEALDNAAMNWELITLEQGNARQRRHWQELKSRYPATP